MSLSDETSNLKLPNPAVGNVNWANDWYDMTAKLDKHPGVLVTTSDNMPADPWTGQLVYVEDLKELQSFDGSEWILSTGGGSGVELVTSDNMPNDPYHGQVVYVLDLDELQTFNGSEWLAVGGGDSFYTVAANHDEIPNPVNGQLAAFTDLFTLEIWFIDRWTVLHSITIPRTVYVNIDDYTNETVFEAVSEGFGNIGFLNLAGPQNGYPRMVTNQQSTGSDLWFMKFDAPGYSTDVELTVLFADSKFDFYDNVNMIATRVTGGQTTASFYFIFLDHIKNEWGIGKYQNGEREIYDSMPIEYESGQFIYFKLSTIGSEIKGKWWFDQDPEPEEYMLTYEDPEALGEGEVGYLSDGGNTLNIAEFTADILDE